MKTLFILFFSLAPYYCAQAQQFNMSPIKTSDSDKNQSNNQGLTKLVDFANIDPLDSKLKTNKRDTLVSSEVSTFWVMVATLLGLLIIPIAIHRYLTIVGNHTINNE